MSAVYDAAQMAELFGLSEWSLYEAARRHERGEQAGPLGALALRCGRRLVWPRRPVDRLLGLGPEEGTR
jgi:hypothetical protein